MKRFLSAAKRPGLLFAAAALAGCSGGGSGYGGSGGGGAGGGGGGGNVQADFQSIQDNIFTPICTACHAGAAAPHGLRLDEASAYALLVGVPSDEQPQLQRVDPGHPDQSYLIQKLEGTAAIGGRMPLNGTPLPQADIDAIRQWITDGAQRTVAAPPSAPIRVTTMTPLPDSSLEQLPATIMVAFDREVDAASVNTGTLMLERSGGDGTFGDGNEVAIQPVSVTVPAANTSSAVLDVSTTASVPDTYRLTLVGTGPATIVDLDTQALDGEFAGTFPSGDGTQGGNFQAIFTVGGVQATLDSIQANVFTPICSACHTGQGNALPGALNLTNATASMLSLVGVASLEQPGLQRVAPADPDRSYIVMKLEGTAATGARMPFGGPPLDAATVTAIRQWIANGAQR